MNTAMPVFHQPMPPALPETVNSRGMSLLELVIVIAVICILMGAGISRLLPFLDEAERVGVLTFESQTRSMLMLAAAKRMVSGQTASISALDGSNPMALMLEKPRNYVGELDAPDLGVVPRRSWYFDRRTRHLVYRPGRPFGWLNDRESMENPEFVVRIAFDDIDGNGIFDAGTDALVGVRLQRAAGTEWLTGRAPSG